MKFPLQAALVVVISAVLVTGCGQKPETDSAPAAPSAPAKVSVSDAPAEAPPPPPGAAAAAPAATPPPEEEKLDELTQVTQAIQSFAINNERPPKDLNELVKAKMLKSIPTPPPGKKFLYDPSRMSIKLVDQ